ncbi:MAG: hypothetical protein ACRDTJ_04050 [Pseudonocardiaceae bacterium]
MTPGWLDALPPGEGKDRLMKTLREAAEALVRIMPDVEKVVDAYVDKGTEMAEQYANEGDE